MNLVGTHARSTAYLTISSDILMTPQAFLKFSNETGLYIWDDQSDMTFVYSEADQKLRICSHTDVSCVIEDDQEELEESTDLIAILQKYMSDEQTVRLVTTFDGPDCFGANVVMFNRHKIIWEISTNDVVDQPQNAQEAA